MLLATVMLVSVPPGALAAGEDFPVLEGPYFGQRPPVDEPLLFAPGIISREGVMVHDTPVFSPDGERIYWGEFSTDPNHTSIRYSELVDGVWTAPRLVPFSSLDSYGDGCPFVMPGGEVLYFSSFRALPEGGASGRERIWYVNRDGDGWGEPRPAGEAVNSTDLHWQTSVSADRTLYFGTDRGIMRSRFVDGRHREPEAVAATMNPGYVGGTPFIAPDGSYLVFSSEALPRGVGKRDLYIGFRREDGTWADPLHLGDVINTPGHDLCPIVTPDGRFLLYLSWRRERQGVYWVSAGFIEESRRKAMQAGAE